MLNSGPFRWDPCIEHHGSDVEPFFRRYFDASKRVLFLAGIGFDPRSVVAGRLLASTASSVEGLFLREVRPSHSAGLEERARLNRDALAAAFATHVVADIEIFGSDGAVVGGRNVARLASAKSLDGFTDVVVDVSGLSVGTSFPLIRQLLGRMGRHGRLALNLHVVVTHEPAVDAAIEAAPSDAPGYVHGFRGRSGLDEASAAARLWLPQLSKRRRGALIKLFEMVSPDDTCPILPWPSQDPRFGDELAEAFISELEGQWSVDARNIVYAEEDDPLDLYRTILRLDDLRRPVFESGGGSLVILSPLGSKVMALGALMAALERDLPVAYLESTGYELAVDVPPVVQDPRLIHIWLEGDVYPPSSAPSGREAA